MGQARNFLAHVINLIATEPIFIYKKISHAAFCPEVSSNLISESNGCQLALEIDGCDQATSGQGANEFCDLHRRRSLSIISRKTRVICGNENI